MTDREAFEKWVFENMRTDAPSFKQSYGFAKEAWQAATLAERERCAKLCLESKVDMAHWVGNDIANKIRGE